MTTFAPDYTLRVRAKYLAAGHLHVFQVRGGVNDSAGAVDPLVEAINDYWSALVAQLASDFEWQEFSFAYPNDSVFIPVPGPQGDAPLGQFTWTGRSSVARISAMSQSGRGIGSKGRLYLFGLFVDMEDANTAGGDGVVQSTELPGIASATAIANSNFRAGNGSVCTWYPRFTYKVNDRWLRTVRRAG